jgi:hypothetical protein
LAQSSQESTEAQDEEEEILDDDVTDSTNVTCCKNCIEASFWAMLTGNSVTSVNRDIIKVKLKEKFKLKLHWMFRIMMGG